MAGTAVAKWVDLGDGTDAVQMTVAQQPIYKASAIKGKPALQFGGVDDVLYVPLDISYTKYKDITIVAVFHGWWPKKATPAA